MSERHERIAKAATTAKHHVDAKLGHIWWAIMLRGVLAMALALCAFIWPEMTIGLLVKLLGGYFLIDGVIGAVSAIRSKDKTSPLLQTIVSLAIGLILLLWSTVSAKVFLVFVGIWLALQGVGLFLSAMKMESIEDERGLSMAIGGVMALIGAVFVFWTDTGVVSVSWLIGIGALIIGILLVFLATRVRRLKTRINSLGDPS